MAWGREQVAWSADVWAALDTAVFDGFHRSAVALRFIPFSGQVVNAMTLPADVVDLDTMTIDESAVVALLEPGVEFGLTQPLVRTCAAAAECLAIGAARPAPVILGLTLVLLLRVPWESRSHTAWPAKLTHRDGLPHDSEPLAFCMRHSIAKLSVCAPMP